MSAINLQLQTTVDVCLCFTNSKEPGQYFTSRYKVKRYLYKLYLHFMSYYKWYGTSNGGFNLAYSVLQWFQAILASSFSTVLETSTVYIFYSGVAWDQGVQSPGRSGTFRHSDIYLTKQCDFKCFKLVLACIVCTVPAISTVLIPTQMWPEIRLSRVPGGI